jgi:AcrR family transcriptional regulator
MHQDSGLQGRRKPGKNPGRNKFGQTTKEEILNAAVDLFNENGYLKTSMVDIAQMVGLTKGGIYHYVNKKEDLLMQIHEDMIDAFHDRIALAVDKEIDPYKKLVKWINVHVSIMRDFQRHI